MSNAVDRERERRDDHCPACGEGIDWEDNWHAYVDDDGYCWVVRRWFDMARLDLAHLND